MWRGSPAGTALCAALLLTLALAGCSGGEDDPEEPAGSAPRSDASATPGIDTVVEVGEVAGRIDDRAARRTAGEVADVVDGWLDAAYVGGDYPRSDFDDVFRGFTDGAARLAARQRGLMSNAAVGDRVDSVTARRRVVRVDLLAPRGRPSGATAHLNLVMVLGGERDRTEQVRGRLLLTPVGKGWRVFGFDIERGEVTG